MTKTLVVLLKILMKNIIINLNMFVISTFLEAEGKITDFYSSLLLLAVLVFMLHSLPIAPLD